MSETVEFIEALSIEQIRDPIDGPAKLAELGRRIFELAQNETEAVTESSLSYVHDRTTKEPVVVWNRTSLDLGNHEYALTVWSENSYVLFDNHLNADTSGGLVVGYLFGNDVAISGLVKAMRPFEYDSALDTPKDVLALKVHSYQNHPSGISNIGLSTSVITNFQRIIMSIAQE